MPTDLSPTGATMMLTVASRRSQLRRRATGGGLAVGAKLRREPSKGDEILGCFISRVMTVK